MIFNKERTTDIRLERRGQLPVPCRLSHGSRRSQDHRREAPGENSSAEPEEGRGTHSRHHGRQGRKRPLLL